MLKIGDKIKYVKANPLIEMPLGTTMTVTDIQGIAVAVEANCQIGTCNAVIQGVMSYDEVEKYFEKTIEEEVKKSTTYTWTKWQTIKPLSEIIQCLQGNSSCTDCPYYAVCDYDDEVEYKTNGKKIMVRLNMGNKYLKSYATCHKTDSFNLNTGLRVALARLNVKIAQERLNSVIEQIG